MIGGGGAGRVGAIGGKEIWWAGCGWPWRKWWPWVGWWNLLFKWGWWRWWDCSGIWLLLFDDVEVGKVRDFVEVDWFADAASSSNMSI